MITLSDGTLTINLPADLQWRDEFEWTPVEHSTDYSLTGALIVQEALRQDGRPITLYGGQEGAWAARSIVQALHALASTPGRTFTLTIYGTAYHVMFRRPAIVAEEIMRLANPGSTHQYALTINLMEINP